MWSQAGLRNHHYEQSYWWWWDSSWAISNPKRWYCESASLNIPANLENSAVATELEKVSFHFNPKERPCQSILNYHTVALISHARKVMFQICQARLLQYMNREIPDVQAAFRKGRGRRDQTDNIHWIIEKEREFQKNISDLLIMPKPLIVWTTTNSRKFSKRWKYQTTWPASWEICIQVKKQQLELSWNYRLLPNQERSMSRLYIVTLLI